MRRQSGRHAVLAGVTASVITHALLFLLDPGLMQFGPLAPGRPVRPSVSADAFTIVPLQESTVGNPTARSAVASPEAAADARDSLALSAGIPRPASRPYAGAAARTLAERLRAPRDPSLWALPIPAAESAEERAVREVRGRLAKAREEEGFATQPGVGALANGDFGVRIPFGRKPPGPAQVIPAPARLAALALDSTRPDGERVQLHYGHFTLLLPARVAAGETFSLLAHFPYRSTSAAVTVFVDGERRQHIASTTGVAQISLTLETTGPHRIMLHIVSTDGAAPAELVYTVNVRT